MKRGPKFDNNELQELYRVDSSSPKQPEKQLTFTHQDRLLPDTEYRSKKSSFQSLRRDQNIDYSMGVKVIRNNNEPESTEKKLISKQLAQNKTELKKKQKFSPEYTRMYYSSYEEEKKKAVINIDNSSTFPGLNNSVADYRLGTVDKTMLCYTCKQDIHGCTGHFGIMHFPRPFPHPLCGKILLYILRCICHYCGDTWLTPLYIKLAGISGLEGEEFYKACAELSDKLHGLHNCPEYFPYEKELKNGYMFIYKTEHNGITRYAERDINNIIIILDSLPAEKVKMLKFNDYNKASNMIKHAALVTPTSTRITRYADGIPRDDFKTQCYVKMIALKEKLISPSLNDAERSNYSHEFYDWYYSLIKGSETKVINKGDKDVGFLPEISGKEGTFRKHILGKRVNSSARSVGGPDSKDNMGQTCIPEIWTTILTMPEKVTEYNYERLSNLFKSGGAKYLIINKKKNDKYIVIDEHIIRSYNLELRDTVIRPIQEGDLMLINRQPTLTFYSIQALSIKLHKALTVGLPDNANKCLNADFDGDEFNVHIPQTVRAVAEATLLLNTKFCTQNTKSSRAMMGWDFNGTLSAFLATAVWDISLFLDVEIDDKRWNKAINKLPPSQRTDTLLHRGNQYGIKKSARLLLSSLFPTNYKFHSSKFSIDSGILHTGILGTDFLDKFDTGLTGEEKEEFIRTDPTLSSEESHIILKWLQRKHEIIIPKRRWEGAIACVGDSERKETLQARAKALGLHPRSSRVLFSIVFPINFSYVGKKIQIKNGILVKGTLTKDHVSSTNNALGQILNKLYSYKEAARFINDGRKIYDWFIMWHNFSIGYKDVFSDRVKVRKTLNEKLIETQMKLFNIGAVPKDPILRFFWDKRALEVLSVNDSIAVEIGQKILKPNNGFNIAGENGSKAKGSKLNLTQILAFLGLQRIKGEIPDRPLNNGTRCMPTYLPDDFSLVAFGMILSSFIKGLTVTEFMMHMAGAREGQVDTANNTADIGYTTRRMRKTLANTFLSYLGAVVGVDYRIYQFQYGDYFNAAQQQFVENPKRGKVLSFCSVVDIAEQLNSEFENEMLVGA